MTEKSEANEGDRQRQAMRSLFTDLPTAFQDRLSAVRHLRDLFHNEIVLAMTPSLNNYFQSLPDDTVAEKNETASHINGVLRSIGLTIRGKNGQSGLLVIDTRDATHPDYSRFRLETRDATGHVSRSLIGPYLKDMEFMQHRPREDFWARRQQRRTDRER